MRNDLHPIVVPLFEAICHLGSLKANVRLIALLGIVLQLQKPPSQP
jgi:hypothetical protein